MKFKVFKTTAFFLGSHQTTIILMVVYGILLGIATFIEKYNGIDMAKNIYYSPIIGLIWFLMIVNWILQTIQKKYP